MATLRDRPDAEMRHSQEALERELNRLSLTPGEELVVLDALITAVAAPWQPHTRGKA